MKVKGYSYRDGHWVSTINEVPILKHYWYSLQTIVGYYMNKFRAWKEDKF